MASAIRTFRDKDTQALYQGRHVKRFAGFRKVAERKLQMLDAATSPLDPAALPGNRLEALKGDRRGQLSIRINGQWRVCFRWDDGAWDVEIVDYH